MVTFEGCNLLHPTYYDHIIRDENDFNKHLDYIHYNSVKHLNIASKDWEFFSLKNMLNKDFIKKIGVILITKMIF